MRVNNNSGAFSVFKYYERTTSALQNSMEKLSSGLRIVRPGDDAAGLAISEKFRAQIANSNMAVNNIQNAIALVQTADGWMQNIHDMLNRMSELYVEAYDGTKANSDRVNLRQEFSQIMQEIASITTATADKGRYNTNSIFKNATFTLQVGADYSQTFTTTAINLQSSAGTWIGNYSTGAASGSADTVRWSGVFNISITSNFANLAAADIGRLQVAINYVSRTRATLGAQQNRLEYTMEGLRNYTENIGKAESIIRDVNVAQETTKFTRNQILVQSGTAMLAQANTAPQSVLALIGG